METLAEVLPCGCEKTYVNGKWVWISCDEHETGDNMDYGTRYTKYRRSYDFEQ